MQALQGKQSERSGARSAGDGWRAWWHAGGGARGPLDFLLLPPDPEIAKCFFKVEGSPGRGPLARRVIWSKAPWVTEGSLLCLGEPGPLLVRHDVPYTIAGGQEHLGVLVMEVLLAGDGRQVLEEEGLPGHVLGHLGVDLVALGRVEERVEADVQGVPRWEVGRNVLERVSAVQEVEALHVAKEALGGHGVQEALHDCLLTLLPLHVGRVVVAGHGVLEALRDQCVGCDDLVVLQPMVIRIHPGGEDR